MCVWGGGGGKSVVTRLHIQFFNLGCRGVEGGQGSYKEG